MRRLLAVCLLLMPGGSLRADSVAESRAKLVAPFLDSQTVAVVRIDVRRVDPDALARRIAALLKLDGRALEKEATVLGDLKKRFAEAGGKEVYLVISLADLPQSSLIVVPLAVGKDEKALMELFRQVGMTGLERRGDAVGAGTDATLKRLRDLKPDPRPDLAKAFDALGDNSDADFVFLPPAELRKAIDETMPKLPAEIGGGSSKPLTDGLRWAAARLTLTPKAQFEVVVQTKDAATARTLRDLTRKALEQAVKLDGVKQIVPKGEKLVELFALAASGDRLTLKVTEEQVLAADVLGGVVAAREKATDRVRSANNLRQLGIAMHVHHDNLAAFPAHASYSKDGKPLLSWRVHILPYIEEEKLYKEFKLEEPWDSEHNKKLIAKMPSIYKTPGAKDRAGFTSYLAIVGKDTMFPAEAKGLAVKDAVDGTSNTIFLVEADDEHAVEWTRPVDLKFAPDKPLAGIRPAFNASFVDGSVRYFAKPPEAKVMKALLTRNGGEVVEVP